VTATVFLVRHAAHVWQDRVVVGRAPGVSLGPGSADQLAWLARRFGRERLDAVIASPVERARTTAEAVAAPQGLVVEVDDDLNEIDFGDWTGKPVEELAADPEWEIWCARKSLARAPGGGESVAEVQARMARVLERVRRTRDGQAVALVSHGDPIKALVAFVLGFALDRFEHLDVAPASVSVLAAGAWGTRLLSLNERLL
jgi:probable phosphoglycerate mutase